MLGCWSLRLKTDANSLNPLAFAWTLKPAKVAPISAPARREGVLAAFQRTLWAADPCNRAEKRADIADDEKSLTGKGCGVIALCVLKRQKIHRSFDSSLRLRRSDPRRMTNQEIDGASYAIQIILNSGSGVASSKVRVYSCWGRDVISSEAPISTISPRRMTAMRSHR